MPNVQLLYIRQVAIRNNCDIGYDFVTSGPTIFSSFLQHVRDYHPRDILERDEYMALRRQCCIDLDMAYREEPAFELPDPQKVRRGKGLS